MVYFQTKNPNLSKVFEGLGLGNVNIFFGHLEYFKVYWGILWPLGTFCVHLVHFSGFGIIIPRKSGNPDLKHHLDF
jgi:hypothetical protein